MSASLYSWGEMRRSERKNWEQKRTLDLLRARKRENSWLTSPSSSGNNEKVSCWRGVGENVGGTLVEGGGGGGGGGNADLLYIFRWRRRRSFNKNSRSTRKSPRRKQKGGKNQGHKVGVGTYTSIVKHRATIQSSATDQPARILEKKKPGQTFRGNPA